MDGWMGVHKGNRMSLGCRVFARRLLGMSLINTLKITYQYSCYYSLCFVLRVVEREGGRGHRVGSALIIKHTHDHK